jgi:hypothetical protein
MGALLLFTPVRMKRLRAHPRNSRNPRLILRLFLLLSLTAPCLAQETPAWEFFGGYSLQRSGVREFYKATPNLYTSRDRNANLSGWDMSLTENVNRWFGGTLDLSGHYKTQQVLGSSNRERIHSVLYGPRFFYRTHGLIPFAHVLIGLVHADRKVISVGPNDSDNAFAVAPGGGLDMNLGKKAAVRLFQAEYFRTNLRTEVFGTRPNGYRASFGIVFYLGKGK